MTDVPSAAKLRSDLDSWPNKRFELQTTESHLPTLMSPFETTLSNLGEECGRAGISGEVEVIHTRLSKFANAMAEEADVFADLARSHGRGEFTVSGKQLIEGSPDSLESWLTFRELIDRQVNGLLTREDLDNPFTEEFRPPNEWEILLADPIQWRSFIDRPTTVVDKKTSRSYRLCVSDLAPEASSLPRRKRIILAWRQQGRISRKNLGTPVWKDDGLNVL
ncbi:MAG: hypothetical protein Fues2KO_24260 [Fuerstiella sp.]